MWIGNIDKDYVKSKDKDRLDKLESTVSTLCYMYISET